MFFLFQHTCPLPSNTTSVLQVSGTAYHSLPVFYVGIVLFVSVHPSLPVFYVGVVLLVTVHPFLPVFYVGVALFVSVLYLLACHDYCSMQPVNPL